MRRTIKRDASLLLLLAFAGALALAAAACNDSSAGTDGVTGTEPRATTTAPVPTAGETRLPQDAGQEPIFWRTSDNFASVHAGESYKVLFRVTNGYSQDVLPVTARCTSCPTSAQRQDLHFEADHAEPVGDEAPGSYYPFGLELPLPGSWEVVVTAGDASATIHVEVQPAAGGGASG